MKKIVCLCLLLFFCFNINVQAEAVSVSARAAVLINAQTGSVIYSVNPDVKLPMASTTKIMTGLILAEQNCPEKTVCVTDNMINVEGSSMGLRSGDVLTYSDLLYGLMLPSGNDAANVIAYSVGGSINNFVDLMNKRAADLSLKNTYFVTPSGLDGMGHGTTALDLARLTAYALGNDTFRKVVGTKQITLEINNGKKLYLSNHNKLLKIYDGAIGVKTGYTSAAGRCLVSAAERDGVTLICVTLNDKNDWDDHKALLDYGFDNCRKAEINPQIPATVPLYDGMEVAVSFEGASVAICDGDMLTYSVCLPNFLYAPVQIGEKIGFVQVYCNNKPIKQVSIYACETVDSMQNAGFFKLIINNFLNIFRRL